MVFNFLIIFAFLMTNLSGHTLDRDISFSTHCSEEQRHDNWQVWLDFRPHGLADLGPCCVEVMAELHVPRINRTVLDFTTLGYQAI